MDEIQYIKGGILSKVCPALSLLGELQEYTVTVKWKDDLPDSLIRGVEALLEDIQEFVE